MDLSQIKVGDQVYSYLKGWGKVCSKTNAGFQVDFSCEYCKTFYQIGRASCRERV